MFTGIVECTGKIVEAIQDGSNNSYWISSPITHELKVDQSVSHEGICLTVEEIKGDVYKVTAIEETILKTNIEFWQAGRSVNLERCMQMNGRLDGHIVQGHVDATAQCMTIAVLEGSWEYTFEFDEAFAHLVIEKGSVCVNGTSLTCFNVTNNSFRVAIIPYTFNNTTIGQIKVDDYVNIEFDVVGKYLARFRQVQQFE